MGLAGWPRAREPCRRRVLAGLSRLHREGN